MGGSLLLGSRACWVDHCAVPIAIVEMVACGMPWQGGCHPCLGVHLELIGVAAVQPVVGRHHHRDAVTIDASLAWVVEGHSPLPKYEFVGIAIHS